MTSLNRKYPGTLFAIGIYILVFAFAIACQLDLI
jgi:hypothetical protein